MSEHIEVYSRLTRAEALDPAGIENKRLREVHRKMSRHLIVMAAPHLGYDRRFRQGQLVVHEAMQQTFEEILEGLIELKYPIQQIVPIVKYGWRDDLSMAANNTSVYRPDFIGDPDRGKASEHTRGSAIDLNPLDNPLINPADHLGPRIEPVEAIGRIPHLDAFIMGNTDVVALFDEHRMEYGGYWPLPETKDYYGPILQDLHHFELRPGFVDDFPTPDDIGLPAAA